MLGGEIRLCEVALNARFPHASERHAAAVRAVLFMCGFQHMGLKVNVAADGAWRWDDVLARAAAAPRTASPDGR